MLIVRGLVVAFVAAAAFTVAYVAGSGSTPPVAEAQGRAVVELGGPRPAIATLRRQVPTLPGLRLPRARTAPPTTGDTAVATPTQPIAPTATAAPPAPVTPSTPTPATGTSPGTGSQPRPQADPDPPVIVEDPG